MSQDLDIDVFEVLERLGVERVTPASGGSEAHFSCPLHGPDERPSAYMNVDTGLWTCHACHERGNLPGFVAKVLGVAYSMAVGFLREVYGVDFREPEGSMAEETKRRFSPEPPTTSLRPPSDQWLRTFVGDLYSDVGGRAFEYIRGRGFSADTIAEWQLGYDMISDRLVVPVRDLHGRLVGFKGRALEDEVVPKFLILGDYRDQRYGFDPYEASQVVFGLQRNRDCDVAVICESELDAIALVQMGVERPTAIGMSYLTDAHARLLVQECREVVSFFDSDRAGEEGLHGHVGADGRRLAGALERLQPHVVLRVVEPHDRDPAKLLQDGDEDEALALIERAQPSVASSVVFG